MEPARIAERAERHQADGASDVHALSPDTMVDHFRVVRLLGRGGMGEVYLARDTKLGRRVALKMVRADALGNAQAVQRFMREAQVTARFSDPHIVTIFAVGEHLGCPYIAIEYLDGQDLRQRMASQPPGVKESLRIGQAIAGALSQAHRNQILHRDLKPENVVLPKNGRLRVVDFGLAKSFDASELEMAATAPLTALTSIATGMSEQFQTASRGLVGTPLYMAPEQWLQRECSTATDIWALGVMLWELLSHKHPYAKCGLFELCARVCSPDPAPTIEASDVPQEVAVLVARCLEKEKEKRPSAQDIMVALEDALHPNRRALPGEASPFRGLLPFTEQQADLFFGRDAEVAAFLERLRTDAVLPVVGPSGAGKSSFVQAGVIPRLREQGRLVVLTLRPGRQPFDTLASRLLRGETQDSEGAHTQDNESASSASRARAIDDLSTELTQAPARVGMRLQHLAEQQQSRVLLFVDQLEELFTLVDDDGVRRSFMEAICSAADDLAGPVRVVFTLRDDFLGRAVQSDIARETLSRVTVLRSPGAESLEEVMLKPVRAVGHEYGDPDLVRQMIAEVRGETSALPLLQFAGQALWEKRDQAAKKLTRSAYDEMNGVAGALAHHADGVVDGLAGGQEKVARELLLRLVTPEGTRRAVPKPQLLNGLLAEAAEVLDQLSRARLVVARKARKGDESEAEIELVHESLISNWDRLARWIDDSREDIAFLGEIAQAAALWDKRGRREEEVWQGDALHEALRRSERMVGLSDPIQRFLEAGRNKERRRFTRRRRLFASGFALLALVAVAAVGLAVVLDQQKREVRAQKDMAERKQAEVLREAAAAALGRDDMLEARAKLRAALEIEDSRVSRALWARMNTQPSVWTRELPAQVYRVAYAPDGSLVAAACDGGSFYLLDPRTARSREFRVLAGSAISLVFSPDSKSLFLGTDGSTLEVFDVRTNTGRVTGSVSSQIAGLAISRDGRLLASALGNGKILTWSLPELTQVRELTGPQWARRLAVDPAGRLAAAGADTTIRLWETQSGASVGALEGHGKQTGGIAFSSDGRDLFSGDNLGDIRHWNVATGSVVRKWRSFGTNFDIALSPDGTMVAEAGAGGIQLSTLAGGAPHHRRLHGHTQAVAAGVAFSPDGRRLVSGANDRTVRMWNAKDTGVPPRSRGHADFIKTLAISQDDMLIASGSTDQTIRIWNSATGVEESRREDHTDMVLSVAFSQDGRRLAAVAGDALVSVYDAHENWRPRVIGSHRGWARSVAISRDAETVVSGGWDNTVRVWNATSGGLRWMFASGESQVNSLALRGDGRELASAGGDGDTQILDLLTGKEIRRHKRSGAAGWNRVIYAPNGSPLGLDHDKASIFIWNLSTGENEATIPCSGRRTGAVIAPDAKSIGVTFEDGSAAVWTVEGVRRIELRGHRKRTDVIAFSPSGKYIVTGGRDNTVRLWESATGRPAWRSPVLLSSPAELCTQEGWRRLDDTESRPSHASSGWRLAVEQNARLASRSADAKVMCIRTHEESLLLWDLTKDEQILSRPLPGIESTIAVQNGCATLMRDGRVLLNDREGGERLLADKVRAMALQSGELLVAGAFEGQRFDAAAARIGRFAGRDGVTAVGRVEDWIAMGLGSGRIELLSLVGVSQAPPDFSGVPSTQTERIIPGPEGALIAGFGNGFVGVWEIRTGQLLRQLKLHGPAVHLLFDNDRLYAATELGDYEVLDLAIFRKPYCDLLGQVWSEVPIVWEGGIPVLRDPPPGHPCARQNTR